MRTGKLMNVLARVNFYTVNYKNVLQRQFYATFVSASFYCIWGDACYFRFFKAVIDGLKLCGATLSMRPSLSGINTFASV